ALALVFPAQVVIEARAHSSAPASSGPGLQPLPPGLLEADYGDDLNAALAEAGSLPAERPVNVLLIAVDALRADHVGPCGNDWIQTPSMDALASASALSCSTYTQQPQTNPAIAS